MARCAYALAMREIVTRILLPFDREQVWAVLADLRRYRDWNPLNISADGEAVPGRSCR